MHYLSKQETRALLTDKKDDYNSIVERAITLSPAIYLIKVENEDFFYSLLYNDGPSSKIITPTKEPRCLRDVVQRLDRMNLSFSSLAKQAHPGQYDPDFFKTCEHILTHFEPNQFDYLCVMHTTDYEKKYSPAASFYLCDGNHRALVLAYMLYKKRKRFNPFNIVFFSHRQ